MKCSRCHGSGQEPELATDEDRDVAEYMGCPLEWAVSMRTEPKRWSQLAHEMRSMCLRKRVQSHSSPISGPS